MISTSRSGETLIKDYLRTRRGVDFGEDVLRKWGWGWRRVLRFPPRPREYPDQLLQALGPNRQEQGGIPWVFAPPPVPPVIPFPLPPDYPQPPDPEDPYDPPPDDDVPGPPPDDWIPWDWIPPFDPPGPNPPPWIPPRWRDGWPPWTWPPSPDEPSSSVSSSVSSSSSSSSHVITGP
jgi:hypothetical protein